MAENVPPVKAGTANGDATAGVPFYEKQRQHLKELIARRRALEKRLVSVRSLLIHPDILHHPAFPTWFSSSS
jgi:chromatin modification-related protein EAF6